MSAPEVPLTGGNASAFVARVGDTVRKPWIPSAPSIQRLLEHLRTKVGDLVPEPRGRDDQGRQILEYVPGVEVMSMLPIDETDAEEVGASIRALHEAAASFQRNDADVWTTAMRRPGDQLIGHNDLAPWNLIRGGGRMAFIDWDGAGPTTCIADLAYAARAFAQLDHEHGLHESIPRLRAVLDGYDASAEQRKALVPAMIERAEAMRDLLVGSIATGTQPWAGMAVDRHADFWSGASDHLHRHAAEIEIALR
ncbi:phosphotransferase [Humibacter antri]